jgi:sn1-specific diacylglycerol lipase
MSLNELAVDLTCDPVPFKPGSSEERPKEGESVGLEHLDRAAQDSQHYEVHGGMLKLARAMGSPDKAVHGAVKKALTENEGYGQLFVFDFSTSRAYPILRPYLMWT